MILFLGWLQSWASNLGGQKCTRRKSQSSTKMIEFRWSLQNGRPSDAADHFLHVSSIDGHLFYAHLDLLHPRSHHHQNLQTSNISRQFNFVKPKLHQIMNTIFGTKTHFKFVVTYKNSRCLKITEKVAFNIASEADKRQYVGQVWLQVRLGFGGKCQN